MNPEIQLLQPYPFERLSNLLDGAVPAAVDPIALSIGEPRHSAPEVALNALTDTIPVSYTHLTLPTICSV